MMLLPAGRPSARGADRRRRCGCAACPASWRGRTRCATRVVPSSTAAALMIGLTLVVSMGVFASSLKASFGDIIGDSTNADLFITPSSTQGPGFSPEAIKVVAGRVRGRQGLRQRLGQARFDGADSSYSSVDPATATAGLNLRLSAGSVSDLGTRRGRRGAVRRDDARLEGRRHHRDRVRRDRQARPCRSSASTTARAGSATTSSSASPRRPPLPVRS